ncbi:glycosyltransferase family 9 protein [Paralcaligenes ginsengisoli]
MLYAMDAVWWKHYLVEVQQTFKGEMWSTGKHCPDVTKARFMTYQNSGAGAIALAAHLGAKRIMLLGYDCQKTNGQSHWHGDHPRGLGNAGSVDKWPAQFRQVGQDLSGIEIVNCSRATALTVFPTAALDDVLMHHRPALFIEGMHGLGDNLHQRSVIRQLSQSHDIWLETPWPCLYYDLDVHVVSKGSKLRTQAKNAAREASKFESGVPREARRLTVSYPPEYVRQHGSVLGAMSAKCGVPVGDFSLSIPHEWQTRAQQWIDRWNPDKPILIYRPLVERAEWGGCRNRNPDHTAYATLFESIRDRFFVVSVADLQPKKEWAVGHMVNADVTLHSGELDIEVLAALVQRAALVFTSPGFAVILAQSVGTASVVVFGGYESSASFSAGAALAPYLGIDPIAPCQCFSHTHRCVKKIDLTRAEQRLLEFVDVHIEKSRVGAPGTAQV